MLRYIIGFYIIVCRHIDGSVLGDYDQIIFSQHCPVSSFIQERNKMGNDTSSVDHWIEYINQHLVVFQAQRWIVHGLWPIKFNGPPPTLCDDGSGTRVRYHNEELDETFRQDLQRHWPSLSPNKTEEDTWETEFNVHGSCISDSVSDYFTLAMDKLNAYNIGIILGRYKIIPSGKYSYYSVAAALNEYLHTVLSFKCVPDQVDEDIQYLLEVRICLNRKFELVNCHYYAHECHKHKSIVYPGSIRQ